MQTAQTQSQALVLVNDNDLALVKNAISFVRSTCQVSAFDSEQTLIEQIKRTKTSGIPSCVIVSASRLTNQHDGLIAQLRDITYLPVILLGDVSTYDVIESVDSVSFVNHPLTEDKISIALLKALGWSAKYCQLFQQSERFKHLNERELNIVTLATEGVPNKSIAKRLGISIKTIERNRRCAYEKLGVTSTAAMAMLFTFRKFCVNEAVPAPKAFSRSPQPGHSSKPNEASQSQPSTATF